MGKSNNMQYIWVSEKLKGVLHIITFTYIILYFITLSYHLRIRTHTNQYIIFYFNYIKVVYC